MYMPQRTVYIRSADLAKWDALNNKAAAISSLLNGAPVPERSRDQMIVNETELLAPAVRFEKKGELREPTPEIKTVSVALSPEEIKKTTFDELKSVFGGQVKDVTPRSSIPAPITVPVCCLNHKKRCQHWDFDEVNARWVNRNTAEVQEVV